MTITDKSCYSNNSFSSSKQPQAGQVIMVLDHSNRRRCQCLLAHASRSDPWCAVLREADKRAALPLSWTVGRLTVASVLCLKLHLLLLPVPLHRWLVRLFIPSFSQVLLHCSAMEKALLVGPQGYDILQAFWIGPLATNSFSSSRVPPRAGI